MCTILDKLKISNPDVRLVVNEEIASHIHNLLDALNCNKLCNSEENIKDLIQTVCLNLVCEYMLVGECEKTRAYEILLSFGADDLKLVYEFLFELLQIDVDGYPVIDNDKCPKELESNKDCIESVGLKLHGLSINNRTLEERVKDIFTILFSMC